MCTTPRTTSRRAEIPRIGWGQLYTIVGFMAAMLTGTEVFAPAGLVRAALRAGITLVAFAAMAFWAHANRAGFDYSDWCECASEKTTVRVIPSARPDVEPPVPLGDDVLEPVVAEDREPALT